MLTTSSDSKLTFNKRRPKFMQPGSFLDPGFQNLFDLGYFQGVKELVPTGWGQVDDEKTYPTLASRNPQLQQTIEDESSTEYDMANGQTGSESSNEDDPFHRDAFSSTTRMNEESSDEDELAGSGPVINSRVSLSPSHPPFSVSSIPNFIRRISLDS
jgi:hypothetical protein